MRRYASLFFFCAVLTFVSSVAPMAAENAAEYRAPVTGAKLGPAQPAPQAPSVQPAPQGAANATPQIAGQPAAPGQQGVSGQASAPGQSTFSGQAAAAPQMGAASGPAPWPSGGMMPYLSLGAQPAPASPPDSSTIPAGGAASNAAAMPGSAAVPGYESGYNPSYAPGYAPDYAPTPAPSYAPGYVPYPAAPYPAAPYPAAPYAGGQGGDVVYGTSQLQGDNFNDRGIATQYRDPRTGDIVTSVVPPSPPEQQNFGTIFVAPQIYPDGNNWGGNSYVPTPRPGQPYTQPPVTWQPPPPDHNRPRHSDRRPDDRRHDDRRHDDRYDARPGAQGSSPYDQRDADRSRDGREKR